MSISTNATIHASAVIEDGAVIGDGTEIGPFCHIGPEVVLGANVTLKSHVAVHGWTHIGDDTVIFPFASIGHIPQDLKFSGEHTQLIIGQRNRIREHVTMNPGTTGGGGITKIGDDGLFMMGVHVGHDCIVGDNVILANNASLGGHCIISDGVVIGALAGVHQFCRIGEGAMIGGLAAVVDDVIPFGTVMGDRANLSGLNLVGLKRRGMNKQSINDLRHAFDRLFDKSNPLSTNVAAVRDEYQGSELVEQVIEFLGAESLRGICVPEK